MRRAALFSVVFLLAVSCALGARAERLGAARTGTVASVSGAAEAQLAALGVVAGAPATLSYGVESTTPAFVVPGNPGTAYSGGIVDLQLTIGGYEFVSDPDLGKIANLVIVQNDLVLAPGIVEDSYLLNVTGTDGGVLDVGLLPVGIASGFADIGGAAMSDEGPFQDANLFGVGTLALEGDDAEIQIVFGVAPPPPPPNSCLAAQIGAGGDLCREVLKCMAARAKDPSQAAAVFAECVDQVTARFESKFDEAAQSPECLAQQDGATTAAALAPAADSLDALVTAGADPADKDDSKLRSAVLKASSKAVGKALKGESKDAKKRRPEKLAKVRAKVRTQLGKKVDKALRKAAKKGVDLGFASQDVVDDAEALIDEVVASSEGAALE